MNQIYIFIVMILSIFDVVFYIFIDTMKIAMLAIIYHHYLDVIFQQEFKVIYERICLTDR